MLTYQHQVGPPYPCAQSRSSGIEEEDRGLIILRRSSPTLYIPSDQAKPLMRRLAVRQTSRTTRTCSIAQGPDSIPQPRDYFTPRPPLDGLVNRRFSAVASCGLTPNIANSEQFKQAQRRKHEDDNIHLLALWIVYEALYVTRHAEEKLRKRMDKLHLASVRQAEYLEKKSEKDEEMERVRFTEITREESTFLLQNIIQGSAVTFSAGLEIQNVLTSPECYQLVFNNLSGDVTREELETTLTAAQQSSNPGRFHVSEIKTLAGGDKQAEVIIHSELATTLAGMDGSMIRGRPASVTLQAYNGSGRMTQVYQDPNSLSVSFPITSAIRSLSRLGSLITVAGRKKRWSFAGPRTSYAYLFDQTRAEGADPRWMPFVYTELQLALNRLQDFIALHSETKVVGLDIISHGETTDGIVSVRIRLQSYLSVQSMIRALQDKKIHFLHDQILTIENNSFLPYTIDIPRRQYIAQYELWQDLCGVAANLPFGTCDISFSLDEKIARVQLMGSDRAAVGGLKVRIEQLAAGETMDGWHQVLSYPDKVLLRRIGKVDAFFKSDALHHTVSLCGKPSAIAAAKDLVNAELDQLASRRHNIHLDTATADFFILKGLEMFWEMFGKDSAELDEETSGLSIKGSEEVRHQLVRLMDEFKMGRLSTYTPPQAELATCPVCTDDVSWPYKLGCGHVYCTPCLRHWLNNTTSFPIKCVQSGCDARVGIPIIQRFIPPGSFERLLQVAFKFHLETNASVFRNCRTPACNQIYRITPKETTVQCPSCFANQCSSCGQQVHEGMSCEDFKRNYDMTEHERLTEEWLRQQAGVRKCTSCSRLIEKRDGCNHIVCRCGVHLCWACMQIFPSDKIYAHMNQAHGGHYGDEEIPIPLQANVHEPFIRRQMRRRRRGTAGCTIM